MTKTLLSMTKRCSKADEVTEEIHFPPYDANQLINILRQRTKKAFRADILNGDVVPLCSAFATQESVGTPSVGSVEDFGAYVVADPDEDDTSNADETR